MADTARPPPIPSRSPHEVPADSPAQDLPVALEPRADAAPAHGPSAAEEARTIVAGTNVASLASLTASGDPWASVVTYGSISGVPVVCLSDLALHGRNLAGDQRGSLAVAAPVPDGQDPSDTGRVTLAGVFEQPRGAEAAAAQAAYNDAVTSRPRAAGHGAEAGRPHRRHVRALPARGPLRPRPRGEHAARQHARARGVREPLDRPNGLRAATVELARRARSGG